jgi:hypothetical protein
MSVHESHFPAQANGTIREVQVLLAEMIFAHHGQRSKRTSSIQEIAAFGLTVVTSGATGPLETSAKEQHAIAVIRGLGGCIVNLRTKGQDTQPLLQGSFTGVGYARAELGLKLSPWARLAIVSTAGTSFVPVKIRFAGNQACASRPSCGSEWTGKGCPFKDISRTRHRSRRWARGWRSLNGRRDLLR